MSTDIWSERLRARRSALRLAFGVTGCFTLVEASGSDATFVAPMLAAQMLVKMQRPPSLAQGLSLLVLIALSTGSVLLLAGAFISYAAVLILALTLVLYLSFYAHRRGAPEIATLLVQISAVSIPVLAVASPNAASGFAATLVSAGFVALLTVWAAHAAFPDPSSVSGPGPAVAADRAQAPEAARQALLSTLVMLPLLLWFILDATEIAVVVLIVAVTLLRQHDPHQGQRAAVGLILGNLIGGLAASIVYTLLLLNNTFLFFAFACLAASLMFAGRIAIAAERAPLYTVAFATFILLLGLGMTPLPGGSGEAFASRLLSVLFASAYTLGGISLLERWRYRQILPPRQRQGVQSNDRRSGSAAR